MLKVTGYVVSHPNEEHSEIEVYLNRTDLDDVVVTIKQDGDTILLAPGSVKSLVDALIGVAK